MCIGSGVAPVVSHILLPKVDRYINNRVEGTEAVNNFRYVDDVSVCGDNGDNSVGKVGSVFHECGDGLYFAKEASEQDVLQFSDLRLKFGDGEGFWWYNPRAKKSLLAYDSARS